MMMSADEYHARDEVGSSDLAHILRSPLHYWANVLAPGCEREQDETGRMSLGTAAHMALLEPERFATHYIAPPKDQDGKTFHKNSNAYKEVAKAVREKGLELLDDDDRADAIGMANAIRATTEWRALESLRHVCEGTFFARTQDVDCKIRTDYSTLAKPYSKGLVVDMKSTTDIRKFFGVVKDKHYDLKAAFYRRVFARAHGLDGLPDYLWLVVERNAPYACAFVPVGEELERIGKMKVDFALAKLVECRRNNQYPGPTLLQSALKVPKYYSDEMDSEYGNS